MEPRQSSGLYRESEVFTGESEIVKSNHYLHNEIADDPDIRLAADQKYQSYVWWKLDHLTCNGQEFEVVRKDKRFNVFERILKNHFQAHFGPRLLTIFLRRKV